jgi:pyrimidine-specific ribonucleoside hydrolase
MSEKETAMNKIGGWTCRAIIVLLLWVSAAFAHDVYLPIIIDTDVGADDVRAMIMLLNSGESDIRLIVTSDGVLAPKTGKRFCRKLLACMNRPGIPVAAGTELAVPAPQFRKINEMLSWPKCGDSKKNDNDSNRDAVGAVLSAINSSGNEVLYLCFGPMTNLAAAIRRDPSVASKLYRVVYMGSSPDSKDPGWNTHRDPLSAKTVYEAGVPVYGFGMPEDRYIPLDEVFKDICDIGSKAAGILLQTHDVEEIQKRILNHHIKIWDEMAVIYINLITGFDFVPVPGYPKTMQLAAFDQDVVRNAYVRLLGNPADFHLDVRKSVVLKEFPAAPQFMRDDVAPEVEEIIRRHGEEEWKACFLTNELHRHLGIYSLVGAKMGIRAREILEAPFDTLTVASFAGLNPPLSCLNDGLQVSTGASLGRGTIAVLEDSAKPSARFTSGEFVLELTLKKAYVERIQADIKAAIDQFGGLSPDYFAHIRELSIQYWKEFNRSDLFEEQFIR